MSTEPVTVPIEVIDRIQRGTLAAVLHVASANDAAANEIARELHAAEAAIEAQLDRLERSSAVAIAFREGLSREHLTRLLGECLITSRMLEEVQLTASVVLSRGPHELDAYRLIVSTAVDRAAREVKESPFFRWQRVTRAERVALEQIGRVFDAVALPSSPGLRGGRVRYTERALRVQSGQS